jgi:hypothetical protein
MQRSPENSNFAGRITARLRKKSTEVLSTIRKEASDASLGSRILQTSTSVNSLFQTLTI